METMLKSRGQGALYERYRPETFDEIKIKSFPDSITTLVLAPSHPKVFLFHGGTGLGKTTQEHGMDPGRVSPAHS
jgi:hypothetical protein